MKPFCSPCCLTFIQQKTVTNFSTCSLWYLISLWHGWPQHLAPMPWISYGIKGIPLLWLHSYLSYRWSYMKIPGLNGSIARSSTELCPRTPSFHSLHWGSYFIDQQLVFIIVSSLCWWRAGLYAGICAWSSFTSTRSCWQHFCLVGDLVLLIMLTISRRRRLWKETFR